MLEAFSPVILNLPFGNVEIYHTSLFDFMEDPLRSQQYYVDRARAHEYLTRCCLQSLMRKSPMTDDYAFDRWHHHLSLAYPSSELRNLLALFTEKELRRLVVFAERGGASSHLVGPLHSARQTCLSFKWIRSLSDIKVARRIAKASQKVDEVHFNISKNRAASNIRVEPRPVRTKARSTLRAAPNRPSTTQPVVTQTSPVAATSIRRPGCFAVVVLFLCCVVPPYDTGMYVSRSSESETSD